jgi:CubicO group peptidase (beta-lactamase class C family)
MKCCGFFQRCWWGMLAGATGGVIFASDYFPPPESQGGWRSLTNRDEIRQLAGMEPAKLNELRDWLLQSDNRDFAAVIIRRGYVVLEVERGKNARTSTANVKSCAKAICATVLAIAAEESQQGRTARKMKFDDPAFDFIPWAQPLSDPRKARITVKQLFNHTSGLTPEATGAPNRGPWEYVLGHAGEARMEKLAFDPGAASGYSTHALYHAALVCENVTGQSYDQFAMEKLLKPLGIERWWFEFFDGREGIGRHPTHTIGLSARDLARIAYCLLRKGQWGERQVAPTWFVEQTAEPTHALRGIKEMRFKRDAESFSHAWELPARLSDGRGDNLPRDARYKPGSGGQLIAFVPSLDLVVTRQTGSSGEWEFEDYLRRACAAVVKDGKTSVNSAPTTPANAAAENWIHAQFREVDTLFANPGQGWMSQQRSPKNEPRFPCSVVYVRFNWVDAEPEQGKYNWNLIDNVIAAWKPRDATVALRVMTCNAHSGGYYTSPKWLFDAGCKGFEYLRGGDDPTSGGKRIPRLEPDYADPIYLEHHGAFLAALGQRYDGHPNIEFLDIGSYGIWGEWHTPHPAPVEVRKKIVDLYLRAFRKTPLVFMSDDAEVLSYALAQGTGFRRDGVGSPWHEQNWIGSKKYAGVQGMADTWKRAPVVFEWFGDYDYLKSRNWSFDAAVNFMLSNHVTLINDNVGRVPPEAMPQLEKLARLAGYRFLLRELAHEKQVQRGGQLTMKMKWANVGVGKLHRPFGLRLFLLADDGTPALTAESQANPRDWLPGEHEIGAQLQVPASLKPGDYPLAVAMIDPSGQRRPLKLAMDAPEKEGRYVVSRVSLK